MTTSPTPDVSALVAEARELAAPLAVWATGPLVNMIDRLADALEAAYARVGKSEDDLTERYLDEDGIPKVASPSHRLHGDDDSLLRAVGRASEQYVKFAAAKATPDTAAQHFVMMYLAAQTWQQSHDLADEDIKRIDPASSDTTSSRGTEGKIDRAPPPHQPHGDWPSDAAIRRAAIAIRRDKFERNGRVAVFDETLPLDDGQLSEARAAILAATPSPIDVGREEIAYAGYNVAKPADIEDGDEAVLFQAGKRAATDAILALPHPTPEQR